MNINKKKMIDKIVKEADSNITGLIISKNHKIEYSNYFNGYDENDSIHIASITKSIVSILIGIALDKGFIESLDQNILDFFPDYIPKRNNQIISEITIRNLLTMTTPYKYKSEPYTKVYSSDDWNKTILDLIGGKKSSMDFRYSTVGTHLLSGILCKATGMSLNDFACEYLFNPLNITKPNNILLPDKTAYMSFIKNGGESGWVIDPKGFNTSGWGLMLRPLDMLKIGELMLSKGIDNNIQIVSEQYIRNATSPQSTWAEFQLDYGYLWWIIDHNRYAAIGDGGNIIFIDIKNEIVVVIASTFKPRPKDRIRLIIDCIYPILEVDCN